MMNDEYIYMQELLNDGQSVYLHYYDMLGLYVAYGLSAYYADMCSTPEVSYSDSMQMPVALLNRQWTAGHSASTYNRGNYENSKYM